MKEKFLITGYNFDGYHGSMMHICELAEELILRGFDVYIASVEITKEILDYVENTIGAKLFFVNKLPLDKVFDYVLSYHDPILPFLIKRGLKFKHLALGSLSLFISEEQPGMSALYDFPVFVHSSQLKDYLNQKYSIHADNIFIFPNSVPQRFSIKCKPASLKRAAIVSNHIPEELLEAVKIISRENIEVDIYGKKYREVLITPEILKNYDLLITIGKTVQYGLYMGIPVYNYDHFGGVGYINLANIENEADYNFSGRSSYRKISSEKIFEEIIYGYEGVLKEMPEIMQFARDRYSLKNNVDKLLSVLRFSNSQIPDTPEWEIYKNKCVYFLDTVINYKNLSKPVLEAAKFLEKFYGLINKLTFGLCYKNKLSQIQKIRELSSRI